MEQPVFALGKQENIVIPANYPQKYDSAYIHRIKPLYKDVSDEHIFHVALDMLKDTNGEFSRRAILGNNLSQKPIKVMFKDLGTINYEIVCMVSRRVDRIYKKRNVILQADSYLVKLKR